MTQKTISLKAGCSEAFLSQILSGKRRPSWNMAKNLGKATDTDPVLWIDESPDEIKKAIKND